MHHETQIRLDAFSRRKSSTDSLASVSSLQLTLPPTLPRHNSAPYNSATTSASHFDKCYNSASNSSSSHYNSATDSSGSSKLSPASALRVSQPQHAHTTAAEAHAAIRKRPKKIALIEDMAPVAEGVQKRLSSSQNYQSPLSQFNTRFQLKRHCSEQQTVRPLRTMTDSASATDVSTNGTAAAAVVECDVEESCSDSELSEGDSSSDASDVDEDCSSSSSSSSIGSSEEDIEELILSLRTNKNTVQLQQQQQQQQQQHHTEQSSDTAITSPAAQADVTAPQQHTAPQKKEIATMVAIPSADPALVNTTVVQHASNSSSSTDDDVSEVTSGERESSFNSTSSSGSSDSRNSSSSTSTEDDCSSSKGSVHGCATVASSPCSTAFPVHDGEQLDAALSFDTDASSSDSDSSSASSSRSQRSSGEHSSTTAANAAAQQFDDDNEVREYRGNPAYAALCVADHLQLYFKEHVFAENGKSSSYTNSLPLLRMTGAVRAARATCGTPTREALRSLFKETVMPYESSSSGNNSSSGSSGSSSSNGSSGATVQQQQQHMKDALTKVVSYRDLSGAAAGTMTGETPALLIITNVCLYIVAASGLGDGQAFSDAPLPTVLACMPTADLDKVVLTFGLQKLRLVFTGVHLQSMPAATKSQRRASLGNTGNSSSSSSSSGSQAVAAVQHKHASASSIVAATVCFEVVVLTRSPTRTHALIAVLEPLVNDVRRSRGLSPMLLENEDNVLLDAVGQLVAARQKLSSSGNVTDNTTAAAAAAAAAANKAADVMLYQLLFQRYPIQRPWVLAPRSLIVTRSELLLCDENHAGQYTVTSDKNETDSSSGSSVTAAGPVQLLHCLARARLSDVIDVSLEPAVAGQLVISLRARGVLQTKRHWLLQCRTASSAEKVVAELKRLSKAARSKGSTLSLVNTALKDFVL
jgi:trimeric autotransporter adhesin